MNLSLAQQRVSLELSPGAALLQPPGSQPALNPSQTSASPSQLAAFVGIDSLEHDLPLLTFTAEAASRRLVHYVVRDLPRQHTEADLPSGHHALLAIDNTSGCDHVIALGAVLLWLNSWSGGGRLIATGPSADVVRTTVDALLAEMTPEPEPGRLTVEFADAQVGSRQVEIDVSPWATISHLYPANVAAALEQLLPHTMSGDDPRLLIWHGPPGTGKTTAVRALLAGWRAWTNPVVISDPMALLGDARYLRRILLGGDGQTWRLVVIEDAEALLKAQQGGPAVSKLLNLADGLLGQGLRCLFLMTTNQQLTEVHPALLRPGRCLSLVEFGKLSPAEASVLRGSPVHTPMTLAEVMCRDVQEVVASPRWGDHLYL